MKQDLPGDRGSLKNFEPRDGRGSAASAQRLREETRGLTGLTAVMVEERVHPLWLRAGTDDVERAIDMLDLADRGLKFAHEPRRIIEIGAGSGYRAVALACEYPGAEILAVEPDALLQRTALLNTLAHASITYVSAVISAEEGQYGYYDRAGPHGTAALVAHPAGNIKSRRLAQLLSFYRFSDADVMIITPDAASAGILRAPLPPALRLIAVETGGAPLPADMACCYPLAQFITVISGDYVLLYRRGQQRLPPAPRPLAILTPDGAARYFGLENVDADGFFYLSGGGVRLHPNPSGAPLARLILSAEMNDHAELQVSMRVTHKDAGPVRFTVKIFTESGTVLAVGTETLSSVMPRALVLALPEHVGRCEITFTTEMAEPGARSAGAWAEIISATLI